MPSTRQSRSRGDGPLLESWRHTGPSGAWAKAWLIARRTVATLLVIALIGGLAYVIFGGLWRERTYFVYMPANVTVKDNAFQNSLVAPPLAFPYEEFVGFLPLQKALKPLPDEQKPLVFSGFPNRKSVGDQLNAFQESDLGEDDTFILHVVANGVVIDGKACLLCGEFQPATEKQDEVFPVGELLKRLANVPGATKLLLLDAGRLDYAPRIGVVGDEFAKALEKEVAELADPTVWVLSANSPGQRSHVSAALRRSVFGYVIAKGLQGAADLNEDEVIDLYELDRFAQFNVSQWVKQATGGKESQTPVLLGAAQDRESTAKHHLLYTKGLPKIDKSTGEEFSSAASSSGEQSFVSKCADFFSTRISEFGISPVTSIFDKTTKAVLGGDENEKKSPQAEDSDEGTELAGDVTSQQIEELYEEAWRLTQSLDESPQPHPNQFAPQLWRMHLDQLLWLGQLNESGELTNEVQPVLARKIGDLKLSLEKLAEPDSQPPTSISNVIDQIRRLRPLPPLDAAQASSLALGEAVDNANPTVQLPEGRREFVAAYDQWLAPTNSSDFEQLETLTEGWNKDDWGNRTWGNVKEEFYEFALLEELENNPGIPLQTAKLALRVRRLGERAVADPMWGQGWARDKTEAGDRYRLEAERLLRSRAARQWRTFAEANLNNAATSYNDALKDLLAIHAAHQLYAQVSSRARDYLRCQAKSPDQGDQNLRALISSLARLQSRLDVTQGTSVKSVEAEVEELHKISDTLESNLLQSAAEIAPLSKNETVWRLENALGSPLLPAAVRTAYLKQKIAAEQELMKGFALATPSTLTAAAKPEATSPQLPLEWRFVGAYAPTDTVEGSKDSSDILGEKLADLPEQLESMAADTANMSVASSRLNKLRALRKVSEALYLVDACDSATNDQLSGGEAANAWNRLNDARWYDLLVASIDRRKQAIADAPEEETKRLVKQIGSLSQLAKNSFRRRANGSPSQPIVEASIATPLELTVQPDSVSLAIRDEVSISLNVESQTGGDLWLVAQYDPDLLDVTSPSGKFLKEHELRRERITGSRESLRYPYQPQLLKTHEPRRLEPGRSSSFSFSLKRRVNAGADTHVVFKAIGDEGYVRREVAVQMSDSKGLKLLVSGGIERSQENNQRLAVRLHPNQVRDIQLELHNTGNVSRNLQASLYRPEQFSEETIPEGFVGTLAADLVFESFGLRQRGSKPFATSAPLTLEADRTSPIVFAFEPPEAASAQENGAAEELLPHHMLLAIKELEVDKPATAEKTATYKEARKTFLRLIKFSVVEPQEYLTAKGDYDASSDRLRVRLSPIKGAPLPQRIEAQLEIVDQKDFVTSVSLNSSEPTVVESSITRPGDDCVLSVPLQQARYWPRGRDLVALVHVDGYPRAFQLRIDPDGGAWQGEVLDTILGIRVNEPDSGSSRFRASDELASIDAAVEVDAPRGFFGNPGNYVEVGISDEGDRNLRDDAARTLRLHSDRQVEISMLRPEGPTSWLPIRSSVHDFRLKLDVKGLRGRAYLLSRINAAERLDQRPEMKSEVPILLDGDGPTFGTLEYRFDKTQGELRVDLEVADALTGVDGVWGAIEIPGAAELKWIKAKRQSVGPWILKLSTADLVPDQYLILFKAVDGVENETLASSRDKVQLAPPATSEPEQDPPKDTGTIAKVPPKPVTNLVSGRAVNGNNAVRDVEATLTGSKTFKSKDLGGGRFEFRDVPAGPYELSVKAYSRGYSNMKSEPQKITVSDKANDPTRLGSIRIQR